MAGLSDFKNNGAQPKRERYQGNRWLTDAQWLQLFEHLKPTSSDESFKFDMPIFDRIGDLLADQVAKDSLAWLQFQALVGDRLKRTADEFAQVPQAPPVIENVLAPEVNLLSGPDGAGKSLLARDWAGAVASGKPWRDHPVTEPRNVLWIASEGLHDFGERWTTQDWWEDARHQIYVLDQGVSLVSTNDVKWLLEEYRDERPGLVVFDVIYGMGMADENGMKDVLPVLSSMKKISAEWDAATLALGHPPHNGDRRFRGSSMWRQLAYTAWHMDDDKLTCEKSKIADRRSLTLRYRSDYPSIEWVSNEAALAEAAERHGIIQDDFEEHPESTQTARANRVAPLLDVSPEYARRLIRAYERAQNNTG